MSRSGKVQLITCSAALAAVLAATSTANAEGEECARMCISWPWPPGAAPPGGSSSGSSGINDPYGAYSEDDFATWPDTWSPGYSAGQYLLMTMDIRPNTDFEYDGWPGTSATSAAEGAASGTEHGLDEGRDFGADGTDPRDQAAQSAAASGASAAPATLPSFSGPVDVFPVDPFDQQGVFPSSLVDAPNDAHDAAEDTGVDPVNPSTGEFVLERQDLLLPGVGLDFELTRVYRSQREYDGPLGFGWNHNFNQRLITDATACGATRVLWVTGRGATVEFFQTAGGTFQPTHSFPATLESTGAGWRLTHRDGRRSLFDQDGLLIELKDLHDNTIAVQWEPSPRPDAHRVKSILDTLGRNIEFAYSSGRVSSVSVSNLGITIDYDVDASGDLVSVTSAAGISEGYQYSSGFGSADYVPTSMLENVCRQACGLDHPSCENRQSPCEVASRAALRECVDLCQPDDPSACVGSCPSACGEACNFHADDCDDDCRHECQSSVCNGSGSPVCDDLFENDSGEERCENKCISQCGATCADSCKAYVTVGNDYTGLGDAFVNTVTCAGYGIGCAIEFVGGVIACLWGECDFDCGDWDWVREAKYLCCNENCDRCCEFGNGCPDDSCQEDRDCIDDCRRVFFYGADDSLGTCSTDPVEGCRERVEDECAAYCSGPACVAECSAACPEACEPACREACEDPAACQDFCSERDYFTPCGDSCVDQCMQTHAEPNGETVFGRPQEGNHNLVSITDGNGDVFVTNEYGTDPRLPSFDRVVRQLFGKDDIHFAHYDLRSASGGGIAPEDTSYVEANPGSVSICPLTVCENIGGAPPWAGETWLEIVGDHFGVFSGVLDLQSDLARGIGGNLPAHTPWIELRRGKSGAVILDPPVSLPPGGASFGSGDVRISLFPGATAGTARLRARATRDNDQLKRSDLERIEDGIFRNGAATILATERGFMLAPAPLIGAAKVTGVARSCLEDFVVQDSGSGIEVMAPSRCQGELRIQQLGRRIPNKAISACDQNAFHIATWKHSLLSGPQGAALVRLHSGGTATITALERPRSVVSASRPSGGALIDWGVKLRDPCRPQVPPGPPWPGPKPGPGPIPGPGPDPAPWFEGSAPILPWFAAADGGWLLDERILAGNVGRSGIRAQSLEMPSFAHGELEARLRARKSGKTSTINLPGLGGEVGYTPDPEGPIEPPDFDYCWLPPEDLPTAPGGFCTEKYEDAVVSPKVTKDQPIARATVVRDAAGGVWTYYADAHGRLLRKVDNKTWAIQGRQLIKATWDRNYDGAGRIVAERRPLGDRTCTQFDSEWNVVRETDLSAPGTWASSPKVTRRYSWADHARLVQVHFNGDSYQVNHWNDTGDLTHVEYPDGTSTSLTYDAEGRVTDILSPTNSRTHFAYDPSNGQLSGLTADADGPSPLTTTVTHDGLGRPEAMVTQAGYAEYRTRDLDGRVLASSVQLDSSLTAVGYGYAYDSAGHLEVVTGPDATRTFTHGPRGLVRSISDEAVGEPPRTTCFGYNGRGQLTEIVRPEGNRVRFDRYASGPISRIVRGFWKQSDDDWDDECNATPTRSMVEAEEIFETRKYDLAGNLIGRQQGPVALAYRYEGHGRLMETRYLGGPRRGRERVRQGYDALGRVSWQGVYVGDATEIDADWDFEESDDDILALTKFVFDHQGRVVRTESPWFVRGGDGSRTQRGNGKVVHEALYDDALRNVTYRAADGRVRSVASDGHGRPVQITLPDQSQVTYAYSNDGKTTTIDEPWPTPSGRRQRTIHRLASGQFSSLVDSSGHTLRLVDYDAEGRAARLANEHEKTRYSYSPYSELAAVARELDDGTTKPVQAFSYDKNGQLVTHTDGLGHATTYTYDHADRVGLVTLANGSQRSLTYAPGARSFATLTSPDGVSTASYDPYGALARLEHDNAGSSAGWAGSTVLEYSRGLLGLVRASTSGKPGDPSDDVWVEHSHDSMGFVTREETNLIGGLAVDYSHDKSGRHLTSTAGQRQFNRSFDEIGRLDTVSTNDAATPLQLTSLLDYAYSSTGPESSLGYGNGLVDAWTRRGDGRLQEVTTHKKAVTRRPLRSLKFGWTEVGRLGRIDEIVGGTTLSSIYSHDASGRLNRENTGLTGLPSLVEGTVSTTAVETSLATGTAWSQINYDAADNRVQVGDGTGTVIVPTPGLLNEYTSYGSAVATDAFGRATQVGNSTHGYDGSGQLVNATTGNETTELRYDAFGALVRVATSSSNYEYYRGLDGTTYVMVGGVVHTYVAGADGMPHVRLAGDGTPDLYLHYGVPGRPHVATAADGTVAERYSHSAYGDVRILAPDGTERAQTAVGMPFIFAGQPSLAAHGLTRLGARWYRPGWGRFIAPDPMGFIDGPNLFAYAGNRPLAYWDPAGLWKQAMWDGFRDVGGHIVTLGMGYVNYSAGFGDAAFGSWVNPLTGLPLIGADPGYGAPYAAGQIAGSLTGLAVDSLLIAGGSTIAGGGGVVTFATGGTGGVVGVPAMAAGAAMATAGVGLGTAHVNALDQGVTNLMAEMRGGSGTPTRVPKIKNGPKFPNLKDHAARHSNAHPNAYYNQAVKHTRPGGGKPFRVRHDGQTKIVHITRTGPDAFTFTSRSPSGNTIFTHLENVNLQYLRNKGITLPKGF